MTFLRRMSGGRAGSRGFGALSTNERFSHFQCHFVLKNQFQFCDTMGGFGKIQRERCQRAEVQNIAMLSCAPRREVSTSRPVAFGSTVVGSFEGGRTRDTHSWKLFCLLPYWLLRRPQSKGRVGKAELSKMFDQFENRQWATLHEEAERGVLGFHQCHHALSLEQKAKAAEQRVREGEMSRARQCLGQLWHPAMTQRSRRCSGGALRPSADRCQKRLLILSRTFLFNWIEAHF